MASRVIDQKEDGFLPNDNGLYFSGDKGRIRMNDDANSTPIQRFYAGASVLVTGATGFMGKVLIEKLLRSCPDIANVYMVMREKKGKKVEERIGDLVNSPCFDRIKKEQPGFLLKLHAVAGDISLKGLGIGAIDRNLLEEQITIVFHVAATVRFDEHLQLAILQNVRGTREVLNLCMTFRNMKSFVHVSTAYSNCPRKKIDERFYDPHLPSDHAIHLAETLDKTTIDRLSHKLMGDWPNTYSFTKALSEDVVRNYNHSFPVAVVRPSIVISTRTEPVAGWIDNVYGPTGVLVAGAVGLMRTLQCNEGCEANIVPCDMVINATIASAWDVAENRKSAEVPIYNYVAPRSNHVTWKRYMDLYVACGWQFPSSKAIWTASMTLITNTTLYHIYRFLVHILPALLVDIYLWLTFGSPKMMKIYSKIHKFSIVVSYFATQQWDFETKNVDGLWKDLHYKDKELFSFDMDCLDWYRFVQGSWPGMRLYLTEDPHETLPAAHAKQNRLLILHRLLMCTLGVTAIWISILVLPLFWAVIRSSAESVLSGSII